MGGAAWKRARRPLRVDVYTLEVSPEDGEKLALASSQGRLQLALRNATDTETVLTKGATVPETLASFREVSIKRRGTKLYGKRVEVIKGTDVSSETFYQYRRSMIHPGRSQATRYDKADGPIEIGENSATTDHGTRCAGQDHERDRLRSRDRVRRPSWTDQR